MRCALCRALLTASLLAGLFACCKAGFRTRVLVQPQMSVPAGEPRGLGEGASSHLLPSASLASRDRALGHLYSLGLNANWPLKSRQLPASPPPAARRQHRRRPPLRRPPAQPQRACLRRAGGRIGGGHVHNSGGGGARHLRGP